jgi:hypothetical protein
MPHPWLPIGTRVGQPAIGTLVVLALLAATGPVPNANAAETTVTTGNGNTVVIAPTTRIDSSADRTTVRVAAPFTRVKVDTAARHVRIRVPYFNGDIRW